MVGGVVWLVIGRGSCFLVCKYVGGLLCSVRRLMAWGGCHIKVSTGQERVNAGRLSIMGKYVDGLSRSITRSQSQKSACKDLGRDGLSPGHHARGHLHSDF